MPGAGGLDARARKAWEAQRLASLGMSAPKSPRIPASLGIGMAAKAAARTEAARLEEAAVTGGRLAKKTGKGESGASGAARSRGVAWGGGTDTFRGGVLTLSEAPARPGGEEGRGKRMSVGFGGVFKLGGSKRKGGGKGGKSGGKSGGGGGKRKGGGGGGKSGGGKGGKR